MKDCKKKKILRIAIVAGIVATACAVAYEIKHIKKIRAAKEEDVEAAEEGAAEVIDEEVAPTEESPAEDVAPEATADE